MNRKKTERIIINLEKLYNLNRIEKMVAKYLFIRSNGTLLKNNFNRITIVDATGFKLDDKHADAYKGSGIKSSVKIQLQYDLLTGEFIHCDLKEGCYSDASYLETLQATIQENDLILKDLGYLKALDLKIIDENKWWAKQ